MRRIGALYTFILENFWTKVGLKVLFRIRSILENFTVILNIFYIIIIIIIIILLK
jgi:hypothetical protein